MRIVSRKIVTSHSKESVFYILKNSSSRYRPAEFVNNCFQFAFPIHWHRMEGAIPVKGKVSKQNGFTEVWVEIHGGLSLYVGTVFLCIGILVGIYSILSSASYIYSALISFGIGIVIYIIDFFDGITCLDSLEHRLTRKLDE